MDEVVPELIAEVERLKAQIEQVRKVLEDHPKCDKYTDDDVITCGWKRSIRTIEYILEVEPE